MMNVDFHHFVENFIMVVEAKDSYTAGHSDRVAEIAVLIGMTMELSREECYLIHIAGHLHDIGKIGIPDGILLKSGRLSQEEYAVMKMHSEIGYNIFKNNETLIDVAKIIRHHHERYDGLGYPCGLAGDEIPIGARIIAVVDSFDAMVTRRTYKEKMSFEKAKEEIVNASGKQFDPLVASLFLQLLETKDELRKIEEIVR